MTEKQLLTQVICEEEWVVSVGDKRFALTKKQADLLKEATTRGSRGMVWFDTFAISIPHIMYINRRSRNYWKIEGGSRIKIGRREYEATQKLLEA